ncbi:VOC family protein [Streptomyces litmocidini]|uniref:VOC family protein n=1 Tax=Streptomyces litmocidini TaxID=67318 RepID=UPI00340DFF94
MKAQDDSALGRFWAEVLGRGVDSGGPAPSTSNPWFPPRPDPVAVCVDIVARPEPKTVRNRVHLDLATTSAVHQEGLIPVVTVPLGRAPGATGDMPAGGPRRRWPCPHWSPSRP